jgi:hypothetical protein
LTLSVGAVLELLGLGIVGVGLTRTWRQHAPGASLLHAIRRKIAADAARILGRPRPVSATVAAQTIAARASASGHVSIGFPADATIE